MRSALRLCDMAGAFALLPVAAGLGMFGKRSLDPASYYLDRMCNPLLSSDPSVFTDIFSFAESPYPCEQILYIQTLCTANGTEVADLLAEQQCFCPSSYWNIWAACARCSEVHGWEEVAPAEVTSEISRLSSALCTPSIPSEPFISLVVAGNSKYLQDGPITLGVDRFPNDTAVSNYYTPTGTGGVSLGQISSLVTLTEGDGTQETSMRTSTPTGTQTLTSKAPNETASAQDVAAAASGTSASAATVSKSSNAAAATGALRGYGCLVAAGLGAVALI